MRITLDFLNGLKVLSPIRVIFWYFLPLYALTLMYLSMVAYFPGSEFFRVPPRKLIAFYGAYLMIGFVVSGTSAYMALGRALFQRRLIRAFVASLLVVFGWMIVGKGYSSVFGGIPTEFIDVGLAWIDGGGFGGHVLEGLIKTFLVVSAFYFWLFGMYSLIPICIVLTLSLIGKNHVRG